MYGVSLFSRSRLSVHGLPVSFCQWFARQFKIVPAVSGGLSCSPENGCYMLLAATLRATVSSPESSPWLAMVVL